MCVPVLLVLPPSSTAPLWDLGTLLRATRALKGEQILEDGLWGCEDGTTSGPCLCPQDGSSGLQGVGREWSTGWVQGVVGSEVWRGSDVSGGKDAGCRRGAGCPGLRGADWADGAASAGFPAGRLQQEARTHELQAHQLRSDPEAFQGQPAGEGLPGKASLQASQGGAWGPPWVGSQQMAEGTEVAVQGSWRQMRVYGRVQGCSGL